MRPTHLFAVLLSLGCATAQATEIKNIVFVHGAFADGSGWREIVDILEKQGFNTTIVQNPITSLEDDVQATHRVLDLQTGPSILVAHSYGGMVITEAGNRPDVQGLVYVAAFQPEKGESLLSLQTETPAASQGIKQTKDEKFLYINPDVFAADFAADLPPAETDFMSRSQVFSAIAAFAAQAGEPAWRTKKSWAIVATEDRMINPALERRMAKRAGSRVSEIRSSHAVLLSQPEKVADVIVQAAKTLGQ